MYVYLKFYIQFSWTIDLFMNYTVSSSFPNVCVCGGGVLARQLILQVYKERF